ncbi:MAG: molybdopterin-dependent oxidoreductase [Methanoregula sp.]|uniref:molybdopterin oxidoreductase family protein n=1 Tax=Methanoregula sp. TaxID=2052170 RepID=UPI0025D600AA|nr:molybdopterin-dependent oxidoreductase [Methanoregula sp.]MCK9632601.1 molybdopterin-dependent oxidoreductase [Methanoregula sp.]
MDLKYVPSTCPYCGTGCGINLVVKDGQVTGISPWHRNPVNEGKVCIRGNRSFEFVNNVERITTPLIKKDGKFVEASWEDAYKEIAGHLKSVKGDEIGCVASARTCNEDNYVFKNFAQNVVKTASIDYCGRGCNADAVRGLADAFGKGAMTNSITDISDAKAILVIGSNPLDENPLAGRRIIMARKNGAKVIVADARTSATAKIADLHIAINPGTEVAFLNGVAAAIIKAGKENKDFIAKKTKDFEKCKAAVAPCTPEAVAKICGIPEGIVTQAAEIFTASSPASVVTSAGAVSGDILRASANLVLLTGNVGVAGAGVNLLRAKSNAQGAMDMGCVPADNGHAVPAMIEAAAAGKITALYVMGENIASAGPKVAEALDKVGFIVVQDMFMTETAAKAHVFLPSASFTERDGTVTNSERRVQRVRKAVEPIGSSRADWQIICELATAMGADKGFAFKSADEIFEEIVKNVPDYAGITYAMLEKPEAIQWPAAGGVFGSAFLYADKFATKDGKGTFAAVGYTAGEAVSADYPFAVAAQWPRGTLSLNTASIVREFPEAKVTINKADAQKLGISTGNKVKVSGKDGSVTMTANVTTGIKTGVVSLPLAAAAVKLEKTEGA